tara:strand:+ start:335 stop:1468 length:1134 start_codon:yes stop_codon:yes gene_type:complete
MKDWQKINMVFIGLAFTACNEGGTNVESNRDLKSFFDVNTYSLNKLVCDPFSEQEGQPLQNGGLKGKLYYKQDLSSPYNSVFDYIENGVESENHIFFTDLNVPTRRFELGFPLQTEEIMQTDDGQDLVENFALAFDTVISLGEGQEPGYYEFAILSDDGSVLDFKVDGDFQRIVDNDGNHPTKMGCSSHVFYMDADTEFLAKLYYHQGPRYHISAIPMMRKVAGPEDGGKDPSCNRSGNSMYFDYNNNSEPKAAYNNLLARGWEPLKASNYELPASVPFNPCMNGQAPMITDIYIQDILDGQIRVTWKTDILATSQVRIVDLATGEELLTYSDNVLRTEHEIIVRNLLPGTNYLVQAVSISETFGKSLSYALNVQLQ